MDELVERARNGDREAFAALVQATSDRMYATAVRILRDADLAEDALQSAFIAAWRSLPTLRDPARSRLHYATRALRAAIEADDAAPVVTEGRMA